MGVGVYFDLFNYLGSRAGSGKIISARSNTNFLPTIVGKGLSCRVHVLQRAGKEHAFKRHGRNRPTPPRCICGAGLS